MQKKPEIGQIFSFFSKKVEISSLCTKALPENCTLLFILIPLYHSETEKSSARTNYKREPGFAAQRGKRQNKSRTKDRIVTFILLILFFVFGFIQARS